MRTWVKHMPAGMLLRSHRRASHIAHPKRELGLDAFLRERDETTMDPLPLDVFVDYGLWFQQHAVPNVEQRRVATLARRNGDFQLTLDDGEQLAARRVVVAAGILPFAWRPPEFGALSPQLVSHSSEHATLAPFAGRRVVVVGGGQSALESAALLAEAGATVELVARRPTIKWLVEGGPRLKRRYAYNRIGVGGTASSWLFASPDLWRRLPREWKLDVAERSVGPAGADWLRPRLAEVPLRFGTRVTEAVEEDGGVVLRLEDGTSLTGDHVLLGTGYRVDVSRYDFLAPELLREIATRDGAPLLRSGFESVSVPGLHFVGASATETFGPVNRFVSGTWAAARSVTRAIAGRGRRSAGFSW
jgi:NADPH-dependent 2,4-dienoyl-CoA reductase/sulfur reductase-like enzyme